MQEKISENLILALEFAKTKTKICGVVGKNGGYTKKSQSVFNNTCGLIKN